MENIHILGVDLAKRTFANCGTDNDGYEKQPVATNTAEAKLCQVKGRGPDFGPNSSVSASSPQRTFTTAPCSSRDRTNAPFRLEFTNGCFRAFGPKRLFSPLKETRQSCQSPLELTVVVLPFMARRDRRASGPVFDDLTIGKAKQVE